MVALADDRDRDEVDSWYLARGLLAPPRGNLPEIGLIVRGVAACFIWRTDSQIALVDNCISNPAASADARGAAMDELGAAVVEQVRALGVGHLVCVVSDAGLLGRLEMLGFRAGPPAVLTHLDVLDCAT